MAYTRTITALYSADTISLKVVVTTMECQLDHLHQPCSIDVKKYFHLPQYLLTTDSLKLPLVQRFSTGGRDPQGATMHSPGGHKQSLSWIPQTCFSTAIS